MTDESTRRWLEGAIDIHTHPGPSIFPRRLDDHGLAAAATEAGMRAIVIKAHEGSTAERAALVDDPDGLRVFGGVTLNRFVGGINPFAVEAALSLGGKIVWLPTLHAANHIRFFGKAGFDAQTASTGETGIAPVAVLDEAGRLLPEMNAVLDQLAANPDVALSSGHLNSDEIRVVFTEARRRGIERLLLTHPELPLCGFGLDFQQEMADLGAFIERNVLPHEPDWGGVPVERTVAEIRALGPERCILATDFGQANKPTPPDGLAAFCDRLFDHGLDEVAIRIITAKNPAEMVIG